MITEPYTVATLKGIVEALTEFLPVSSTGHLMLMNAWMQFVGDAFPNIVDKTTGQTTGTFMDFFDIFIQFGAILAVCVEFRKTLWQRFILALQKSSPTPTATPITTTGNEAASPTPPVQPTPDQARNFWWGLVLGTLPILAVGYGLKHVLDGLEASPYILLILAAAWIVGGAVMWINEAKAPAERTISAYDIPWKSALWIGLFQCIAMWPGISRSAATIIAGRRLGLSKQAAAEYSFFLAVPALSAASLYKLLKYHALLNSHNLGVLALGTAISFVGAWLIIRAFLAFLRKFSFTPFAIYRILLGLVILGAYLGGFRVAEAKPSAANSAHTPTPRVAPADSPTPTTPAGQSMPTTPQP